MLRLYLQMVQRTVKQLDLLMLHHKRRLRNNASIFSAEMKAIDIALDHIKQFRNTDFIINCDVLSDLQSLHNRHTKNPFPLNALFEI